MPSVPTGLDVAVQTHHAAVDAQFVVIRVVAVPARANAAAVTHKITAVAQPHAIQVVATVG